MRRTHRDRSTRLTSIRMPMSMYPEIQRTAARANMSINSWMVQALRLILQHEHNDHPQISLETQLFHSEFRRVFGTFHVTATGAVYADGWPAAWLFDHTLARQVLASFPDGYAASSAGDLAVCAELCRRSALGTRTTLDRPPPNRIHKAP